MPEQLRVKNRAPASFFSDHPEISPNLSQLLFNRGLTDDQEIASFLSSEYTQLHDPYLFSGMGRAVARVYSAIESKELIAIYGDYDADGVSGSVILETVIQSLGGSTMVYIPHRETEGYGVNAKAVEYISTQGAKLMITCDCGITNVEPIATASSRGVDVIVTDHHDASGTLPEAYAIVHPSVPGETYPFKFLAGGGVAFKVAQALLRSEHCVMPTSAREGCEKWLLDLAAIATVADMVMLRGENRILVKYGLMVLQKNKRPGLKKIFELSNTEPHTIDAETISFRIAPRINAAGRMDHANSAYKLLGIRDERRAEALARGLERHNRERQQQTEVMFQDALSKTPEKPSVVLVYNSEWPLGLTGLVAGKLSKHTVRPAFVFSASGDDVVGSGRAPDGLSVMDALHSMRQHFTSYGGHPQSCGLRFKKADQKIVFQKLQEFFDARVPADFSLPTLEADLELSFDAINPNLINDLTRLQPFGQGNREPLFVSRKVMIVQSRTVGKSSNHLKLALTQNGKRVNAIAFNMARPPDESTPKDILYRVRVNEWNGSREIQLDIESIVDHDRHV